MKTLVDQIEAYLKQQLDGSADGVIEMNRRDLAQMFTCVPSQINYVLETRFSNCQGYVVETRRGGGGFIRLIRLNPATRDWQELLGKETRVSAAAGDSLLRRLLDENFIEPREVMLIRSLTNDRLLRSQCADPDAMRGAMLNSLLLCLLRDDLTAL